MKFAGIVLLAVFISACGHRQLEYVATPEAGMGWDKASLLVEQGFYEDFGKRKPMAVLVTDDYIVLSDGTISEGRGVASAVPVGSAAFAVGSSTVVTKEAGQRLYYSSLGVPTVHQHRLKKRYAVIIRSVEGANLRVVFFRSQFRAQEFASAIEFLRLNHSR